MLDVSGAVISGKAEGDELTVSADGTFDSKDVGTDKTVRISGLTLGGTSAGNYRLAASGQQASAMAAITPAVITVTPDAGQGKTYGEKDPTLTYISAGAVNGETPAFRGVLVRDTGANAGSYAITGGTLALADGSGFKADNYTLKLADEVVYFTIHRAAYGDRTVNGSAMYDNNGTVDLSSLIEEGGTAVLGSVTDDAGVLNGTCSISEGILRFGFADDASKVGKTAKVKVNVTGADNYEDYTITVTLTVEAKLTPSPEGALTLSPAEITYGEKLGAIAIPATNQLMEHDFSYRFKAAGVSAIVCTADGDTAHQVDIAEADAGAHLTKVLVGGKREGWHDFDAEYGLFSRRYTRTADAPCGDDPMLMFFTSGTTGYPKIAVHSYKYALGHYVTARYWHWVQPGGLHFTISETGWGKALWGKLYGQWLCEGAVFTYDFDRFDASKILPMFAKYHITTFCAPPTMYRMLIKQDLSQYDLSSIQHATTAGEALNPEVFYQFRKATGL